MLKCYYASPGISPRDGRFIRSPIHPVVFYGHVVKLVISLVNLTKI